MRLIDADKLKSHYRWWNNEEQRLFDEIVDAQPTADAVPVVHGEWVDGQYGGTECNVCGYECETGLLKEIATAFESLPKCCPNCGAKMDGGDPDAAD